MSRLNFQIENAEVLDNGEEGQFATARIEAFSTGLSLHDTVCDEETLVRTAPSIYEKPIIFEYDYMLGDFGAHPEEGKPIISGFVVNNSATFKKREDGRTTLTVLAKIWKKYSGKFLSVLRNTGKDNKKVSVEIEILDSNTVSGNILKLNDFVYSAICVLGDRITEASPGANMQMLSFAKEENEKFKKAFNEEFSIGRYDGIDFKIPSSVKKNVKKALDSTASVTSPIKASGKFLLKNESISPARAYELNSQYDMLIKRIKKNPEDEIHKIAYMMLGGEVGKKWIKNLLDLMDVEDKKRESYFSQIESAAFAHEGEKTRGGGNPIDADKKLGLGEESREEMAMEKEEEEKEPKEEEVTENKEEVEENKEEEPKETFSFDTYVDVMALLAFLKAETETNEEASEDYKESLSMAVGELEKEGSEKNFGIIGKGMFAKLCKMAEKLKDAEEKNKSFMAENEELKKFKAGIEEERKAYAVEETLKALESKVIIPEEAMAEMREEAKKFSLESIDAWKNYCKAKSFDFAVRQTKKTDGENLIKIGLPFGKTVSSDANDVWANK